MMMQVASAWASVKSGADGIRPVARRDSKSCHMCFFELVGDESALSFSVDFACKVCVGMLVGPDG